MAYRFTFFTIAVLSCAGCQPVQNINRSPDDGDRPTAGGDGTDATGDGQPVGDGDANKTTGDQDNVISTLPADLGVTSSLNKVYFEAPTEFNGVLNESALIELAHNEYEATQIVVFPKADIDGLTLSLSPVLRIGSGDILPARDITIELVGFVNQLEAKVEGDRIGWIPDPLLPNQTRDLTDGILQSYLITVYADPTLAAGYYTGNILLSGTHTGGAVNASIPFKVRVWDFELPRTGQFKTTHLGGWGLAGNMWGNKPSQTERYEFMMRLADLGFRNRLPPLCYLANGLVSWNWKGQGDTRYGYPTHDGTTFNTKRMNTIIDYMLDKGANHFFIALTSNIYKISGKANNREKALRQYLQDYNTYLADRKLQDMVYVYGVDEPWGSTVQQAKKVYTFVKGVTPVLAFMQNTNQNNDTIVPELLGYFDALDINLGWYNVTKIDKNRTANPSQLNDLWWNVNIWPDVHPNLFLEFPLVDARIIGPMSYRFDIQGFEYWQIFTKGSIGAYYALPSTDLRAQWDIDKKSLDGSLIYPGSNGEIFSSLRYESFRDGIEDMEYLYALEKKSPMHPLLSVETVSNLSTFETNATAILDYRRRLAAAILE